MGMNSDLGGHKDGAPVGGSPGGGSTGPAGDRNSLGKAERVLVLIRDMVASWETIQAMSDGPEKTLLITFFKEALDAAKVGLGLKRLGDPD